MAIAEMSLLWPDGAPGAVGVEVLDQPALSVHLPEPDAATGAGVLVCPGGGYRVLASDHEGRQVATWLNEQGIAAFVLRYRVGPVYHSEVSLLDGQRAMRHIRANAAVFDLDPERLGALGFSAGGHLVTALGTRWRDAAESSDEVDRHSARPDFLVPVYAVTNGAVRGRKADEYTATDERVDASTPPAFIAHTHEDLTVSAEQSLLFYRALLKNDIQAELHVYGRGEHGVGLAAGDPDVDWPRALMAWLRRNAFLSGAARTAVSGQVLFAGEAPGLAWVTLLPRDSRAPLARVKLNRDSGGRFTIPLENGPFPGVHEIVITHLSDRYPHDASGDYSLDAALTYRAEAMINGDGQLLLEVTPDPARLRVTLE